MDSRGALAHIVAASGESKAAMSRRLGRSDNYISALFTMRRAPGTDLMAELARACGYRLQLVGHGETIDIDGRRGAGN